MNNQLLCFFEDVKRMLGKRKERILYVWITRVFWGIFWYRLERGLFLLIGKPYAILRIPLMPILYLFQAYTNMDISYKASIGKGLLILHPSIGVVVSGYAAIGNNLTLTGGNVIGMKAVDGAKSIIIGNNCTMGANAVLIGPLTLGNHITIGAAACVVNSFMQDGITLIGVPAKAM